MRQATPEDRLSIMERGLSRDQTDWGLNPGPAICYLGDCLVPQFSHLENGSSTRTYYLMGLF